MKKLVLLTLMAVAFTATVAQAQSTQATMAEPAKETAKPQATAASTANPAADKAAMLEKMKEQFKPAMMAKTGLTAAQVDRVLELNLEMRLTAARELRDLNEADRSTRLAELKAEKLKKFSEIPLTADQIKSIDNFYAEFAKNNPPKASH